VCVGRVRERRVEGNEESKGRKVREDEAVPSETGNVSSPAVAYPKAACPDATCPDAACPDAAYPEAACPKAACPKAACPGAGYPVPPRVSRATCAEGVR